MSTGHTRPFKTKLISCFNYFYSGTVFTYANFSIYVHICTFSKDHRKLWNLQDLLSICLERGDTPVCFAYRTASEGFMVAEKWAKLFCKSTFINKAH